jgi:hypothetical protein
MGRWHYAPTLRRIPQKELQIPALYVIAGQIGSITAQSSYAKPLSSSSILVATWERLTLKLRTHSDGRNRLTSNIERHRTFVARDTCSSYVRKMTISTDSFHKSNCSRFRAYLSPAHFRGHFIVNPSIGRARTSAGAQERNEDERRDEYSELCEADSQQD